MAMASIGQGPFVPSRVLEHIDRNRPSCVPKTGTPVLWLRFTKWRKAFVFCVLHKTAAWRLACEPSAHYGYRIGKLRSHDTSRSASAGARRGPRIIGQVDPALRRRFVSRGAALDAQPSRRRGCAPGNLPEGHPTARAVCGLEITR